MKIISEFLQELMEIKKIIEILIWVVMICRKSYEIVLRLITEKLRKTKGENAAKRNI